MRRTESVQSGAGIDTIIIIGNGFDRWQGLNTSYADFHRYYLEHRDEIIRKLHIRKRVYEYSPDKNGKKRRAEWSDVEVIFTDPFDPCELEAEFWNNFETCLGDIDAERINLFFGKDRVGLRKLERSVKNAKRILTEAFCGWIASIEIGPNENLVYRFGENCVFINFNYTETLEKRFGVQVSNVFHIHGEATDKQSIIFGHNKHPQIPEPFFKQAGGRFRGLYHIEKMLYDTDKHCQDNIQMLIMFLALHGIMSEDIKDIYVLGHSMGLVDLEYFEFLMRSSVIDPGEHDDDYTAEQEDDRFAAMEYAISTYGYRRNRSENTEAAMFRKRQKEQKARNKMYERFFLRMIGKRSERGTKKIRPKQRTENARWHISYYGEKDYKWKEFLMKEMGCPQYELIGSIDECLERWRGEEKNGIPGRRHG